MEPNKSEIVIYQTDDGKTRIDVRMENETLWLTQAQMTALFQTTKQNISLHVKNIFAEDELSKDSVVKEYLTTAADGKKYQTAFYSLDMVIAVGYRVPGCPAVLPLFHGAKPRFDTIMKITKALGVPLTAKTGIVHHQGQ